MNFQKIVLFTFIFFSILNYSQHIEWSKDRKLTYKDFRGRAEGDPRKMIDPEKKLERAATSMIGWNYEASSSTASDRIDIKLVAFFDPKKSWIKPQYKREDVLNHEQKHFDIAEAFRGKLQRMIDKEIKNKKDYQNKFQKIYKEVYSEYYEFQKRYDGETQHGILTDKQKEFDAMIDNMLEKYSS